MHFSLLTMAILSQLPSCLELTQLRLPLKIFLLLRLMALFSAWKASVKCFNWWSNHRQSDAPLAAWQWTCYSSCFQHGWPHSPLSPHYPSISYYPPPWPCSQLDSIFKAAQSSAPLIWRIFTTELTYEKVDCAWKSFICYLGCSFEPKDHPSDRTSHP